MVSEKQYLSKIFLPIIVGMAYLFLYLPITVMLIFSFNDSRFTIRWSGFSLRWYEKFLSSPEVLSAIQTSLIVAISTTLLSLLLGTCFVVAGRWARYRLLPHIFYTNILIPAKNTSAATIR